MNKKFVLYAIGAILVTILIIGILEYNRQKTLTPTVPMAMDNDSDADSQNNTQANNNNTKPYKVIKEKIVKRDPVETKLDPSDPNYRFERYMTEGYGKFKSIKEADAKNNPRLQSVIEALRNKALYPERLSPAIRPKKLDALKWANDPAYREKYINTHEPGRCYESLKAGKDVQRIKRISPYMQMGGQSDILTISVQTTPGAPITFTSFDAGNFLPGKLTSQTIESDSKTGIGTIEFKAGPGCIEDVNILVASPLAAGTLKYKLNIRLDDDPALKN